MFTLVILALVAALAAANGANDVAKGVATLVGSGTARYRAAILWGALTTLAGAALSGLFAARMLALFTKGIVTVAPTPAFTLAVATAALLWVALATRLRLPVSTTHALLGALVGAGVAVDPAVVAWSALGPRLVTPLLLSIAAAYALSAVLGALVPAPSPTETSCVCVGVETLDTGTGVTLPQLTVHTGTAAQCRPSSGYTLRMTTDGLHWLSSGAVGFARGLNDAPKIVAVAGVLLGTAVAPSSVLALVAAAMFVGSLAAGLRVAKVMAEGIVRMDPREGLPANLATALLVAVGANAGLPMSTTHVATGAIAGIAGRRGGRLHRGTLRNLALAWTLTPATCALLAWMAVRVLGTAGLR